MAARRAARKAPDGEEGDVAVLDNDVDDVLETVTSSIDKMFGKGSLRRLGDDHGILSRVSHWVSSRSIVVDAVLRGGRPHGAPLVPFGRQMEISGPPDAGKTSLCAQIAAETQASGGIVIVTDSEERIDEPYWRMLGVDTSRILHLKASCVHEAFDKQYAVMETMESKVGDRKVLLLWDSLGGTGTIEVDPKSKNSPMEQAEKHNMRAAKDISTGMRLINGIVARTCVSYLYTNHQYTKVGTMFGDDQETYGGVKAKYFATVRLRLQPSGNLFDKESRSVFGKRVRVQALKNSMAGVQKTVDAVIMPCRGFVNEYTVFEHCKEARSASGEPLVVTEGSWSTWTTPDGELLKFQGWNGFMDKVVPHPGYQVLQDAVGAAL